MEITRVPFSHLPMLAKMDKVYAAQESILRKFYQYPVDIQSFKQVIGDKSNDFTHREILVATLKNQYATIIAGAARENAITHIEKLLSAKTFTVTTAHQPSLFTGPLYFIYKICSTINLAKNLKEHYPDYDFLPVFVIGGEDHDFEEVNNINIFNKKITWNKPDYAKGAVGMMKTDSVRSALDELKAVLGESEAAKRIFDIIEKSYSSFDLYQEATQSLLHALFDKFGLVVLNMNDAALKRLFIPIMKQEILEQPSKALVEKTQSELEALGYKSQAFAREINLFYLTENGRDRIVFDNNTYTTITTDNNMSKIWTKEEILNELESTPQYFSPNVVLRPLFQEVVLPNLAYIGGGGELAYWLERKTQFEYFKVNFPMLVRRNSVLWLDKGSRDKMGKLDIQLLDLVQDTDILIKQYLSRVVEASMSMEAEKKEIEATFAKILNKALSIDPTLEKSVLSEKTKHLQGIDIIEAKLLKAEKHKHETSINQIKALAQKLFPGGGLQERVDNFLPYYIKQGDDFFTILLDNLNPLEQGLIVISE